MSKILLVDDIPDIVFLTKKVLEAVGHEMMVAEDGKECFNALEKEKPDLILLDIMMPLDDGWEICKKIKTDQNTKDIPVVMYTIRSSPEDIEKSMEYADAQINKPFKSEHLIEVVNSFLK